MSSPPQTFADLYCAQHEIAPEKFAGAVIAQALYPHARALRRLLHLVPGDYFQADFEFVHAVGQLIRPGDFSWEVSDFHAHPANRRALRRKLKVRLSITRLRQIVHRTFQGQTLPQSKAT
jgi:hypothetical protein